MANYYKWYSMIVCTFFIVTSTVGLTVMYSEFFKDVSNGCLDINIGEPISDVCIKEPSWYETTYKPWECDANSYIEKNFISWWVN